MLKTIITRKSNDAILNIVDTSTEVSNGLLVSDANGEYVIGYYDECNKFEGVETLDTITPNQYKYTEVGGFVEDLTYVKPQSDTDKIEVLETSQATTNSTLMIIMDMLMPPM